MQIQKTFSLAAYNTFGINAVAKYFEYGDQDFYSLGQLISGHTLKHLFAALATMSVLNIEKFYQLNLKINKYGKSTND